MFTDANVFQNLSRMKMPHVGKSFKTTFSFDTFE